MGSPTVVNSGISISDPRITACSPKEVSAVQLRRPRSAHEVSSKLSENMASSRVNSVCCYGHRSPNRRNAKRKKKGRGISRPSGTFPIIEVSP
jgi:hypothetical protein